MGDLQQLSHQVVTCVLVRYTLQPLEAPGVSFPRTSLRHATHPYLHTHVDGVGTAPEQASASSRPLPTPGPGGNTLPVPVLSSPPSPHLPTHVATLNPPFPPSHGWPHPPGSGGHSMPVLPCTTLSRGPPLLHATTGRPDAIASSGTMPKCSFWGVYSTAVQAASRRERCLCVEGRNKHRMQGESR